MSTEQAILMVIAALGLLCLVFKISKFIAHRLTPKPGQPAAKQILTRVGIWLYSIFALLLLGGWVTAGIFPESAFGVVFNSNIGRIVWGGLLLAVFYPFERFMLAKGKPLIRHL